jgi:IclR family acetate operon transcriptional repressor
VQPVIRSLRVLTAVSSAPGGISLQGLSRKVDVPVASMHRILSVLTDEQFLVRSKTSRRYFLGPAAQGLANASRSVPSHSTIVHPALVKLAAETNETAFITELVDDKVVCVSLVEGRHPLRLFVRVGQEMPLHAAASARVLLAGIPDLRVQPMLTRSPLTTYTEATPVGVNDLMHHLSTIRARGYDICDDELDRNVWAVSAPVLDRASRATVAAVTLAAPQARMADNTTRERCRALVLDTARQLAPQVLAEVVKGG